MEIAIFVFSLIMCGLVVLVVGGTYSILSQMENQHKETMKEQREMNETLKGILKECKRNSDLVDKYNRAYHI